MNDLTTKEFFRLLSEPSQVSNKEIQASYESFVKHIEETSSSETDYSKVFRLLNHSLIEIDSIKASSLYELGGGYD